jgi:hypothetical protein
MPVRPVVRSARDYGVRSGSGLRGDLVRFPGGMHASPAAAVTTRLIVDIYYGYDQGKCPQ